MSTLNYLNRQNVKLLQVNIKERELPALFLFEIYRKRTIFRVWMNEPETNFTT